MFEALTVDELSASYLRWLYRSGGSKHATFCTFYGIGLRRRRFVFLLPTAKLCLRGWDRLLRSKSYPPITWECAVSLATSGLFAYALAAC